MAKVFTTGTITSLDIDQIIITRTMDENGAEQLRVRANVSVGLVNTADSKEIHTLNIPINLTDKEIGLDKEVAVIRSAVLTEAKIQINDATKPVI